MTNISTTAALLLVAAIAGCATSPANYAGALSAQDPKWRSPECARIRAEAVNSNAAKTRRGGLARGLLLGPYGVGIALAIKENEAKQRKLFARNMHLRCSSAPLPRELQVESNPQPTTASASR